MVKWCATLLQKKPSQVKLPPMMYEVRPAAAGIVCLLGGQSVCSLQVLPTCSCPAGLAPQMAVDSRRQQEAEILEDPLFQVGPCCS